MLEIAIAHGVRDRLSPQITSQRRLDGNTVDKVERLAPSLMLEQQPHGFTHDGRVPLTKVDRAAIRPDDSLFLGVDIIVRQTALAQFLQFQLGERHRDGRQVRPARRQFVQEHSSSGPKSQGSSGVLRKGLVGLPDQIPRLSTRNRAIPLFLRSARSA